MKEKSTRFTTGALQHRAFLNMNGISVNVQMIYRELRPGEYELLKDFTYEAIFIPEGVEPPDRSIVELPELSLYYDDFGSKADDYCLIAEDEGTVAGAAWVRIMDDYGHVDERTPSLAISVLKEYRGKGTGTQLLKALLEKLKSKGYESVSLAVQKENYAVRMYKQAGFITISENDEEYIMVCGLSEPEKCGLSKPDPSEKYGSNELLSE